VFCGGPEISKELLKERFDYMFFTGGETVGKIVMKAAADTNQVVGMKRAPAMNPRPQNPDPFFSSKSQFLCRGIALKNRRTRAELRRERKKRDTSFLRSYMIY
jgi:hypothetical protein